MYGWDKDIQGRRMQPGDIQPSRHVLSEGGGRMRTNWPSGRMQAQLRYACDRSPATPALWGLGPWGPGALGGRFLGPPVFSIQREPWRGGGIQAGKIKKQTRFLYIYRHIYMKKPAPPEEGASLGLSVLRDAF
nr:hypothetical protein [Morchella crassipes]